MSQIVTIKMKVSREALAEALEQVPELVLGEEREWGTMIVYREDPGAHILLAHGEIEATSPSEGLLAALERLAAFLGAEVVHEEDLPLRPGEGDVRMTSAFWPVLCLILLIVLVWKW